MSFNFPVLIDWFYLHHFIFLTLCLQSPFSLLLPSCSSHISSKYFLNISCFKSKSPFLLLCLQNPHPLLPKYLLVYFILSTITSVSLYYQISQKSGIFTRALSVRKGQFHPTESILLKSQKHSEFLRIHSAQLLYIIWHLLTVYLSFNSPSFDTHDIALYFPPISLATSLLSFDVSCLLSWFPVI